MMVNRNVLVIDNVTLCVIMKRCPQWQMTVKFCWLINLVICLITMIFSDSDYCEINKLS